MRGVLVVGALQHSQIITLLQQFLAKSEGAFRQHPVWAAGPSEHQAQAIEVDLAPFHLHAPRLGPAIQLRSQVCQLCSTYQIITSQWLSNCGTQGGTLLSWTYCLTSLMEGPDAHTWALSHVVTACNIDDIKQQVLPLSAWF